MSAARLESRLLSMIYEARGMYPGCAVAIDAIAAYTKKLFAEAASDTPSETKRTVKYVRMPIYDKRIGNGDDYAGDAWVRWTAVGQIPEDLDASTSTVR